MRHNAVVTHRFLLAFSCGLAVLAPGCACPNSFTSKAHVCIELDEQAAAGQPFGTDGSLTGQRVSDDELVAASEECGRRHSVTVATAQGNARFSWDHDDENIDAELDVDVADGVITVDHISNSFEGGSAFVIRDADGLAIAIEAAFGLREVDDAKMDHGFFRASLPTVCGVAWTTGVKIETPDATHDVWVGTSVAVTVGGQPMRFHAFHGSRYFPWVCTDTQDTISWALVREPS